MCAAASGWGSGASGSGCLYLYLYTNLCNSASVFNVSGTTVFKTVGSDATSIGSINQTMIMYHIIKLVLLQCAANKTLWFPRCTFSVISCFLHTLPSDHPSLKPNWLLPVMPAVLTSGFWLLFWRVFMFPLSTSCVWKISLSLSDYSVVHQPD